MPQNRDPGDLIRKARMDHQCAICKGLIPNGRRYNSHLTKDENGYKITKMHINCMRDKDPESSFEVEATLVNTETGTLQAGKARLPRFIRDKWEKAKLYGLKLWILDEDNPNKRMRVSLQTADGTEASGMWVKHKENLVPSIVRIINLNHAR